MRFSLVLRRSGFLHYSTIWMNGHPTDRWSSWVIFRTARKSSIIQTLLETLRRFGQPFEMLNIWVKWIFLNWFKSLIFPKKNAESSIFYINITFGNLYKSVRQLQFLFSSTPHYFEWRFLILIIYLLQHICFTRWVISHNQGGKPQEN